jgi:ABC-type glycerol-3-phosphate transport system substrate-binding protein
MPPKRKQLPFCISVGLMLFVSLMIAGCSLGTNNPTPTATSTPTVQTVLPSEPSIQPNETRQSITIWIPPLLAPETSAGALLSDHLKTFEDAYALIDIDVRIKEENGPSGILETINSASIVAPSTLPEIVLLDPSNLNSAALKNLIEPLDDIVPIPETPEWYSFAIDASYVDGSYYGMPFISAAEAFAYRKESFEVEPKDWADLLGSAEPILIPLGDQTSKFTLIQYVAAGGGLFDDNGSPTIDPAILADLFMFYLSAKEDGQLPLYALQLQSAQEAWSMLIQGNTNAAVIPIEVLHEALSDDVYLVAPWPTRDGTGVIPTQTLTWAVVVKNNEKFDHISQILQWLSDSTFQGKICETLGMIPAKPAALQAWADTESSAILSRLVRVAVPEPNIEETTTFGPLLWSAVEDVLNDRSTPEIAAESVSDQVTIP